MNRLCCALGFLFCITLASCTDNTVTNPQDIVFPSSYVSFSRHVQPFLGLSCAFAGCHDSQTRAGNTALTSYFDLFSFPAVINIDTSQVKAEDQKIMQVLEGRLGHPPPYIDRVTQNQRRGMLKWIEEGFRNN